MLSFVKVLACTRASSLAQMLHLKQNKVGPTSMSISIKSDTFFRPCYQLETGSLVIAQQLA
jgi:hypothetical protein